MKHLTYLVVLIAILISCSNRDGRLEGKWVQGENFLKPVGFEFSGDTVLFKGLVTRKTNYKTIDNRIISGQGDTIEYRIVDGDLIVGETDTFKQDTFKTAIDYYNSFGYES